MNYQRQNLFISSRFVLTSSCGSLNLFLNTTQPTSSPTSSPTLTPVIANDDTFSIVSTDQAVTLNVLSNDVTNPDNQPLTTTIVTDPTQGSAVVDADGNFEYTPPSPTFSGDVTLTYRVCLADGVTCDEATVTISVTATAEVSWHSFA